MRLLPCQPPQTLMSTPPLAPEHAAVGTSRDRGGDGVFLVDHQTLRLAAGLVVVGVVLAGLRLVAQAELQAAAAGLQAGVVQRLLQLRRVLPQHRQRFRLFDREMRRHLAVAVDIDAHIDAAEIGGIEPHFEMGLAALRGGGDLDRQPADRHGRAGRLCHAEFV